MNRLCVWLMRALLVLGPCLATGSPTTAMAQSSSLYRRASANTAGLAVRPVGKPDKNTTIAMRIPAFFTVKPTPKRMYKTGDLVTVIVRQKSTYTHSGKTDQEREVEIKAELKDWIRLKNHRLIPASMPEGDPKINFKLDRSFEGSAKKNRTDEVVTRVTCRVINIMPNGCLVLEGGPDKITTDGETQIITLTGTCRSEDIGPDNTILSTQMFQCNFTRDSAGAVRDSMRRGWASKLWDWVRPF